MAAALPLMTKDRNGPKISFQALLIPATDASVDTGSYREYGTGRFTDGLRQHLEPATH